MPPQLCFHHSSPGEGHAELYSSSPQGTSQRVEKMDRDGCRDGRSALLSGLGQNQTGVRETGVTGEVFQGQAQNTELGVWRSVSKANGLSKWSRKTSAMDGCALRKMCNTGLGICGHPASIAHPLSASGGQQTEGAHCLKGALQSEEAA